MKLWCIWGNKRKEYDIWVEASYKNKIFVLEPVKIKQILQILLVFNII